MQIDLKSRSDWQVRLLRSFHLLLIYLGILWCAEPFAAKILGQLTAESIVEFWNNKNFEARFGIVAVTFASFFFPYVMTMEKTFYKFGTTTNLMAAILVSAAWNPVTIRIVLLEQNSSLQGLGIISVILSYVSVVSMLMFMFMPSFIWSIWDGRFKRKHRKQIEKNNPAIQAENRDPRLDRGKKHSLTVLLILGLVFFILLIST